MKNNFIAKKLLQGMKVSEIDAARLVLEAIEFMGEMVVDKSRTELMNLLRRVIYEGIDAIKNAENTVAFSVAAWESVAARSMLRPSTKRDLRHFIRRMLRVEGVADKSLRSFTTADCKYILETAFGKSLSSYKKGRAILHSIFAYGQRNEWIEINPVSRIKIPRMEEKLIVPLSPSEVEKLVKTARRPEFRDMLFSLTLMLYGGIRPTEVSRLREGDFNWDEQSVIIRPRVSKTGGGRVVPLRGMRGILKHERYVPRNWVRKWRNLRRAAGFFHWQPDACRHTYASYYATMFKNLNELQLEMGHSDVSLLRSRYMMPTRRKDAMVFWQGIV
ncbi:MAG: tyrosine-type recombinase/integrase [Akkermansia sp.]|nr:tyrosine-type recombinase/integrase [Akkermansia sp.]